MVEQTGWQEKLCCDSGSVCEDSVKTPTGSEGSLAGDPRGSQARAFGFMLTAAPAAGLPKGINILDASADISPFSPWEKGRGEGSGRRVGNEG